MNPTFNTVEEMLERRRPREPVYCIYPGAYRRTARRFVEGFPGRVLYAVKANDHPDVLKLLHESGVGAFDCASVPEIALVRRNCPSATPFFMTPAIVVYWNRASPAAALPETSPVLCSDEAVSTTSLTDPSASATESDDDDGDEDDSLSPPPQDESKKTRGRQRISDRMWNSCSMPSYLCEMLI